MTDAHKQRMADMRIGLQLALNDVIPPLEFLGLLGYEIQSSDVGRAFGEIIQKRVDERREAIELDAGEHHHD